MIPPLHTPRLRLVPLAPGDPWTKTFAGAVMEDEAAVRGFPRLAAAAPDERERILRERWLPAFAEAASRGLGNYLLHAADGGPIGWCGLHRMSGLPLVQDAPELGYALVGGSQGRGLMREAVAAVIHDAFTRLHLPAIHALIAPWNEDSVRLAGALGFLPVGEVAAYGVEGMGVWRVERARK